MVSHSPSVGELRVLLLDQIFTAFARPLPRWLRSLLTPFFSPIAHKFALLTSQLDQQIARYGIVPAASWFLPHFVDQSRSFGVNHIPNQGPLVVAGNHPGAYDILVLTGQMPRQDIKIIVSDERFYRTLPHLDPYLIYVTHDPHNRMAAVRLMLHHLKNGGAVIIFPSGEVDPDPAVLPGAAEALSKWSQSLAVLLRGAPQASLVLAITSGVLSPKIVNNPITHIPPKPWQRRKLAEFFQVMLQISAGRKFNLVPCVSFSPGFSIRALPGENPGREIHGFIQQRAVLALREHMDYFYDSSN